VLIRLTGPARAYDWWILASNAKGATALVTRGEIDPGFGNVLAPGDVRGGRFVSGTVALTVLRAKPAVLRYSGDDGRLT
jgi:hypothetical protein